MRARVITMVLLVAACGDSTCPMGTVDPTTGDVIPPPPDPRWCELGFTPAPDEIAVAPTVSCASGACLRIPLEHDLPMCSLYTYGPKGLCTASCAVDADCEGLEGPCVSGYTCGVATTVGPYCCQRLCMCKDYVDDATASPAPCDATNPANQCCNLAGRPACSS
jgi:hypothetical protein